jgi:glycosyltransferase involved in cell wall biosynthesis
MFLSVVMPVYNEEACIESVVLEHVRVLENLGPRVSQWEVVCVDDASRDRSAAILAALSRRDPRVRLERNPTNLGIFGAFTRCYQEARGDYVYSTGSDGQWPPENLEPMLERLLAGAGLVVGVRTNRREVYTVPRRIVSYFFNHLPRLLFGVAVQDAGSVKLGSRAIFQWDLISKSPFFEAERIIKAARSGYKVAFVPIRFVTRSGGKASGSSWKNIRTSVRDMFRCLRVYGIR